MRRTFKLQKSKVKNTCLLVSFAMAMDVPQNELLNIIHGDANEIWWPRQLEPQCRRGHHIQEIIDVAWINYNKHIIEIQANPTLGKLGEIPKEIYTPQDAKNRMQHYLSTTQGVIVVPTHAVAWDGYNVYDPKGTIYQIEKLEDEIRAYYIVI